MTNFSEDLRAIQERLMENLLAGKESTIQLQTHLRNPLNDEGSVSKEELGKQILRSFTESVSIVQSSSGASAQIEAVDCGGSNGGSGSSGLSGERKKKAVKDRRGCYNRKKTSDSWTRVSPTTQDGNAWRKYGQKVILHSKYPRCYYRCTNQSQGCKAKKQVQKVKEDPQYQITYFHRHTCTDVRMVLPHHIVESDPNESNLLSFQTNNHVHSQKPSHYNSSPKNELEVDTQTVGFPCKKSSVGAGSCSGIIGSGPSGCKKEWSPVHGGDLEEVISELYSGTSMNSFHELDMEVNQIGDIDFDEMYNAKM